MVDYLNPVTELRYDLATYVHTEQAGGLLNIYHQVVWVCISNILLTLHVPHITFLFLNLHLFFRAV